jgi:NitT/TauT family transport system substrate-binding protein
MIRHVESSRQNLCLICACALLCLLAAWCSESAAADRESTRLRIPVQPYFSFAPLYLAKAEGFFAEEGLDVEFVSLRGHGDSLPALLRGDIDIDTMFTVGLLNAVNRGEKIRVVAARGSLVQSECTPTAFLVRQEFAAEFDTLKPDVLRRLNFGIDAIWLDGYFMNQWLGERGLTLRDVKTEFLATPVARVEALRQGSVDVVFLSEPWVTYARESNAGEIGFPLEKVVPDYPVSTITFGPSMLSRNDDTGVRFMRAYLRAVARYAEGKTPRNIEILAKATRLDPDLLRRMCWPVIPLDGKIDAESIVRFSVWAHKQGLVDRPLASADEIWNPDFVNKALQQ